MELTSIDKKVSAPFKRRHFAFFAFALPLLFWAIAYFVQGVYPFGNQHILTVDFYHQYAPFMAELREKILAGQPLTYSFHGGLGIEFWSLFCYYLASPFNLLTLLFPLSHLTEALLLISLLKLAFAGLSFYLLLKETDDQPNWFTVATAVAYACSGYLVAFSWNIMWLDVLLWLPLVFRALLRALRGSLRSYVAYSFLLAIMMISNYYLAFFACVFLFLAHLPLFMHYAPQVKFKAYVGYALSFAVFSLLGVFMAAFVLYPSYEALQLTSAATDVAPKDMQFFDFVIDFLSRLLACAIPSIRTGMANIYSGLAVLWLLPVYLLNPQLKTRVKIWELGVAAFLIFSLNNNILNFYWHGAHYPNQLPFRFSYVFVFWILWILYPCFKLLPRIEGKFFSRVIGVLALLLLLLAKIDPPHYPFRAVAYSLIFLGLYWVVLRHLRAPFLYQRRNARDLLVLFLLFEMGIQLIFSINYIAHHEYYGSRDGYLSGPVIHGLRQLQQQAAPNKAAERPQYGLSREEIYPAKTVNDAILYGMDGLTIFSSSLRKAGVQFIADLGYSNNGINSYQYGPSNILMDRLLGIHRLYLRDNKFPVSALRRKVGEQDGVSLYESDALPLAFRVHPDADQQYLPIPQNAHGNQNDLMRALFGVNQILQPISGLQAAAGPGDTCQVDDRGFGSRVNITRSTLGELTLNCSWNIQQAGEYFFSWASVDLRTRDVYFKNKDGIEKNLGSKKQSIAELGYLEPGKVEVRIVIHDPEKALSATPFYVNLARLDDRQWAAVKTYAESAQIRFNKVQDGLIDLNCKMPEQGKLLLTVPWHPGWQLTVDGHPASIKAFKEALILVDVPAGEHHLQFVFKVPGLAGSLKISLLTFIFALFLYALTFWRGRRPKALLTLSEEEPLAEEGEGALLREALARRAETGAAVEAVKQDAAVDPVEAGEQSAATQIGTTTHVEIDKEKNNDQQA